jgi:MFS family permease
MFFAQTPDLVWLVYVSGVLIGLGFGYFIPAGYVFVPQSVQRITIPKVLSYFVAANALGSFINPYVITATANLINDSIYTRFLLAGSLCLAVTIFAFVTKKIKATNVNL